MPKCDKETAQTSDVRTLSEHDIARLLPGFLHNLNSPLCAMTNVVTLIEEGAEHEPSNPKDMQTLRDSSDRLMQMVGAMQLLVRGGVNGVSELPADELMDLAVRFVRPLYQAKAGRINLTENHAKDSFPREHAAPFLRGMVFLMMDSLQIIYPPPTSTMELTTVEGNPNRMLRFSLSCRTLLKPEEIQPSSKRCEMLLRELGGNLSIQSDSAGNVSFTGQVPLRIGDVFID